MDGPLTGDFWKEFIPFPGLYYPVTPWTWGRMRRESLPTPWNCGVVLAITVGGPKSPFLMLTQEKIQFPWLFLSVLHRFSGIFPEHPKSSPSLRNCSDALLKGVERVVSLSVHLGGGRKFHQNLSAAIIHPLPSQISRCPELGVPVPLWWQRCGSTGPIRASQGGLGWKGI